MVDISSLSRQDKIELLKELSKDSDTSAYFEMEIGQRLDCVLHKINNQLESYLKELDAERERQRRNMWSTTYEGIEAGGKAIVASHIKRMLKEITIDPENDNVNYSTIEYIKKLKNNIINNSLSNRARCTRALKTLLQYEGELADILESGMTATYIQGLKDSYRLSNETIERLDKQEQEDKTNLHCGTYDMDRVMSRIAHELQKRSDYEKMSPEEKKMQDSIDKANFFMTELVPLNPDEHPDVMDFISKL